ncbi:MAG TPA: YgcG family protein [Gammaproteobacteria bacterium]|nr:YgcG family protein [Gammaproteobacteria bacterium]
MGAFAVVQRVLSGQRSALWLFAFAGLFLCAGPVRAQQPIPPLSARVTDVTGTLTAAESQALEQKLAAFEARKGSQIVVLMVPTTAPEAIEAYALRVAEAWQIGRAEIDDGIVLLIAKDDRKLRIEVGYGLEGAVPDALGKRIISERIVPRFYEGDFAGGVADGVDALIGLIDGEPLPAPEAARDDEPGAWGALPFVLMFAAFAAPLFRRWFGTLFGAAAVGGAAGLVAWLISSVLFASLIVGGVAFVFALAGIAGGPGRWSSGGGAWGGARGGGFGGGGGGFRGGGGRFGGGGASGGW